MAMSSTRLHPLREPQLLGAPPRRQPLVMDNLQPVRGPMRQRRSLSSHPNSPVQATQIVSPGSVVSLTSRQPMAGATTAPTPFLFAPRLIQAPQLNPRAVSLRPEREKAEERRSQKADLVQMVEQRQEQERVGLGAESLRQEMEVAQQIEEADVLEVENQWVAQQAEVDRLRLYVRQMEAERAQIETELVLEKAEADHHHRREEIERLQRERYLTEQQELHRISQEEDEQEKEAPLFRHEPQQCLELERALAWQQQEAERIRKEEEEEEEEDAARLEQEREYLVSQSQQDLQQHHQPTQHAHKKEEEQACHSECNSDYDRVSHKIQEISGLEKDLSVEDTDLQPLLTNSDPSRMQKVAALLNHQVNALRLRAKDPKTQLTVASAAGGGVALGAAGAVTGAIIGGAIGAGAGLPAALFTFGLSVPISAAVGGSAGLGLGASAGGTVGAIGGGTAGFQIYNYRARVASLKECPELASPLDTDVAGA